MQNRFLSAQVSPLIPGLITINHRVITRTPLINVNYQENAADPRGARCKIKQLVFMF